MYFSVDYYQIFKSKEYFTTPADLLPPSDYDAFYLPHNYFGKFFSNMQKCSNPISTPKINDIGAGLIQTYLTMQKKIYKVDKQGYDEYVMLDNFDLVNNKVQFFRNSAPSGSTKSVITAKCMNIDFTDPFKLVTTFEPPFSVSTPKTPMIFIYNVNTNTFYLNDSINTYKLIRMTQ